MGTNVFEIDVKLCVFLVQTMIFIPANAEKKATYVRLFASIPIFSWLQESQ